MENVQDVVKRKRVSPGVKASGLRFLGCVRHHLQSLRFYHCTQQLAALRLPGPSLDEARNATASQASDRNELQKPKSPTPPTHNPHFAKSEKIQWFQHVQDRKNQLDLRMFSVPDFQSAFFRLSHV